MRELPQSLQDESVLCQKRQLQPRVEDRRCIIQSIIANSLNKLGLIYTPSSFLKMLLKQGADVADVIPHIRHHAVDGNGRKHLYLIA